VFATRASYERAPGIVSGVYATKSGPPTPSREEREATEKADETAAKEAEEAEGCVLVSHRSPYDRVRVVNADPSGLLPSSLPAQGPSLSISDPMTPFNSA